MRPGRVSGCWAGSGLVAETGNVATAIAGAGTTDGMLAATIAGTGATTAATEGMIAGTGAAIVVIAAWTAVVSGAGIATGTTAVTVPASTVAGAAPGGGRPEGSRVTQPWGARTMRSGESQRPSYSMYLAASLAISSPWRRATMWRDMSIPALTPAEHTTRPLSTIRTPS